MNRERPFLSGDAMLASDKRASIGSRILGVVEKVITSSGWFVKTANVRNAKDALACDVRFLNRLQDTHRMGVTAVSESEQ